ncbi:MAG TPA: fumarylacetoacetate hydrolase family protein [Steroidobacteraceae bacterium]|nr:fumarylacetoacetate hydrolase family protein [Steroidobacteraceae bacterium]
MRLIACLLDGRPALALKLQSEAVPLASIEAKLPDTLEDLLALGPAALERLPQAAARSRTRLSLEQLSFLPPVTRPRRVICVGLNYADHAAESHLKTAPPFPSLFTRFRESFVGHGEALQRPRVSEQFDYEGELVAVIGMRGRHIPAERALEHVAGYTLFNDGSIRDYQMRTTQWTIGKNFDRSGACGPELVTADELPPGAHGLQLRTRLNGRTMQDANTRDMIFNVARLVHECSLAFELAPGDMLVTGTPAGVGYARKPPVFMKAGDVCEIEVEGIGTLRNPVEDEPG